MKIAVVGVGGIGGYFGGRLAQAGEDVVFIARGRHLEALQTRGLRVDSVNGDFTLDRVEAVSEPAAAGQVDFVLLGVKTWQVEEAAATLKPLLGSDTAVLPLQNGVEAPEQLAAQLGKQHVLGGLAWIIAYIKEPGHIVHAAAEPRIVLGELDNRGSARVQSIRSALERAGVEASLSADIQVAMWEKLIFIASVSGVGGVTRATVGEMRSIAESRTLLIRAMEEVYTLGRARGVKLPEDIVERSMVFLDGLPAHGTSSMQRDIAEGRPSELEGQNGSLVRMGRELGIETPVHSFIYGALLPQERSARSSS